MKDLPQTVYVDGMPYHVLGGALRLARDGVARDSAGREVRGRCVDPARAVAWLSEGVATPEAPTSAKTRATKKRPKPRKLAKKKGGS